ncbi:HipA family kinase [Lacinutrix gracilariae]|uniref:HipA family kinase n=1 Tax=Lacinutrix gracilariae TaxID=1747198 RepID=A0ABW5K7S9_9FLAO
MIIDNIHTNSILKEIKTEGHSPLLVMGSDFEMYVAKNDKGKQPPFSLINEFLSSYCFAKWNVATPAMKLITIANELIVSQEGLSNNHRSHYYDTPCFGSKFVDKPVDVNALLITDKKKAFNKLNNPIDVFHITLFDTWVENDDRKPTNYNLILEPVDNKFNILPIDNAFIFSTMSYQDLNPEFVSVSANDHLLVSDLGYLIKKNTTIDEDFINNEREYFYLCIERCEQDFDTYMVQVANFYTIDSVSIASLKEFLFNEERNNKVFEEYVYRLKQ